MISCFVSCFSNFYNYPPFPRGPVPPKKKKKKKHDWLVTFIHWSRHDRKKLSIQYCGKKDSKYLKSVANISKSLKGYEFNLLLNTGDWSTLHGSEWNDKIILFMCSCLLVSKQTFKTKTRQQHMNEVMYINMEQMEHVSYTFCSSSQHNVHIHSVPPKWALATILDPRESHFFWLQHTSNYFLLFKLTNIWYCDTVAQ